MLNMWRNIVCNNFQTASARCVINRKYISLFNFFLIIISLFLLFGCFNKERGKYNVSPKIIEDIEEADELYAEVEEISRDLGDYQKELREINRYVNKAIRLAQQDKTDEKEVEFNALKAYKLTFKLSQKIEKDNREQAKQLLYFIRELKKRQHPLADMELPIGKIAAQKQSSSSEYVDKEKLEKIHKDVKTVNKAKASYITGQTMGQGTRHSFDVGAPSLSDDERQRIEEFYKKTISDRKKKLKSNKPWQVVFKVYGFSDETKFRVKSHKKIFEKYKTEKEQKNYDYDPPTDNKNEVRKFLNLRLSEARVKAISKYLKELIVQDENKNNWEVLDLPELTVYSDWKKSFQDNELLRKKTTSEPETDIEERTDAENKKKIVIEGDENFPTFRKESLVLGDNKFFIESVAYGEIIPPGIENPEDRDERRRICLISSYSDGILKDRYRRDIKKDLDSLNTDED